MAQTIEEQQKEQALRKKIEAEVRAELESENAEYHKLCLLNARIRYNLANASWQLSQLHDPRSYIR